MSLFLPMIPLILAAQSNAAVTVTGVRVGEHEAYTRVVLDLDRPTQPVVRSLAGGDLEVVLRGARWAAQAIERNTGLVRRVGPTTTSSADTLRLLFDLSGPARQELRALKGPDRLVIDLTPRSRPPEFKIMIDPGHGGRAPGAVGPGGTLEKTVVLGICRRLQSELNAQPGITALLTRSGDQTLSLVERIEMARDTKADLFVSVHADALNVASVRGGSVYVLSNEGASNAARKWSTTHHKQDSKRLAGVSLSDREPGLAAVLYDLVQSDTLRRSNALAADVLGGYGARQKVRFDEVRLANFGVLKAPDIPSILVETAYISNPQDERMLASAAGQAGIARAIATGLTAFVSRPGEIARVERREQRELVAAQEAQEDRERASLSRYAVARGDTLYALARRFGVTVATLKKDNRLTSNTLYPGMLLKIPGAARLVAGE
ncbi:MAG: N-acetylmuramoyl-L-alanine amidase [Pseudomonadota bacterium]